MRGLLETSLECHGEQTQRGVNKIQDMLQILCLPIWASLLWLHDSGSMEEN